jgi:hypothetical protein
MIAVQVRARTDEQGRQIIGARSAAAESVGVVGFRRDVQRCVAVRQCWKC